MEKLAERGTSLAATEAVVKRAKSMDTARSNTRKRKRCLTDVDMDEEVEVGGRGRSATRGRQSERDLSEAADDARAGARSGSRKRVRDESKGSKRRAESLLRTKPELIGGKTTLRSRSVASSRSKSRVERGLSKVSDRITAEKKRRKMMRRISKDSRKGEADRHIPDLKPKHLYTGKMGFSRDRR